MNVNLSMVGMSGIHNMMVLPDAIEQACQILKEKNVNLDIDDESGFGICATLVR